MKAIPLNPSPSRIVPFLFILIVLAISTAVVNAATFLGYDVDYTETSQSSLTLTFDLDAYHLQTVEKSGQTFTEIEFGNRIRTMETGYAELPIISATVQIAPDRNVDVTITPGTYVDIALDHPLVPSRGVIYRNQHPADIPYEIDPASIVDEWYPQQLAETEAPFILRDIRGVNVRAYPFVYNAAQQVLRVYQTLTVTLTENTEAPTNPLIHSAVSILPEMDAMYRQVFLNYGTARDDLTIGETGELLVIYTARDADAIQPYIEWKQARGMTVHEQEVAIGTNVKGLIEDAYDSNNNLLYVQLVGDWADIKSNLSSVSSPKDPELGCVVGNDIYPDICIGRFSAQSPQEVNTQINKAIAYEQSPSDGDWYATATGIASDEGPGDDNEYDYAHLDVIWNDKLDPYTYDSNNPIYEPSATKLMIFDALANGTGVINYTGHGSPTSWGTTGFNNSDVNTLTNADMLPIITSVACNNGDFHTGTCFAEAWLRKQDGGAVMMLAATISQPWDPPMRGQDYFMDVLIGGYDYTEYPGQSGINTTELRTTTGAIIFNGLVLMLTESSTSSDIQTAHTWTIFGDVAMQVRTTEPTAITSSGEIILVGVPYTTTITAGTDPVVGATVTMSQDGLYYSAVTDETGEVEIPHDFLPGLARVTVTGYNLGTIDTEITVIPPDGPYLILDDFQIVDDNNSEADYCETVTLDLSLENVGIETANQVEALLTSADDYVAIVNEAFTFTEIPAGDIITGDDAFTIQLADNAPDQHVIPFEVQMTCSEGGNWTCLFNVPVNAPNLVVHPIIISDAAGGDGNGRLDPGETADVTIPTANDGHMISPETFVSLATNSPYITITSDTDALGAIEVGESANANFSVIVAADAPIGEPVTFDYAIDSGDYDFVEPVTVAIGLIVEDFETGDFSRFPWQHSGNADWTIVESPAQEGAYAVKSGTISHNQSTELSVQLDLLSAGDISFFRNLSTESTRDYLRFYVDDEQVGSWSGTMDWAEESFEVSAGRHVFTWVYDRDASGSAGSNAAWLDYIIFPPIGPPIPETLDLYRESSTIYLSWDAPYDPAGLTGYNIYRNGEQINTSLITGTSFGDDTFAFAENYCYVVKAVYEQSESGPSNEVCITPILAEPEALNADIFGGNSVFLDWEPPTGVTLPPAIRSAGADMTRQSEAPKSIPDAKPNTRDQRDHLEAYYIYQDAVLVDSVDAAATQYIHFNQPGGEYCYTVSAVYMEGESLPTEEVCIEIEALANDDEETLRIPEAYGLSQNHPNPFNPHTTIQFALPRASQVTLSIYNHAGQLVQRVIDREMNAGYQHIIWDGTNQNGQAVASGLYFYRLEAHDADGQSFVDQKRMVLLK